MSVSRELIDQLPTITRTQLTDAVETAIREYRMDLTAEQVTGLRETAQRMTVFPFNDWYSVTLKCGCVVGEFLALDQAPVFPGLPAEGLYSVGCRIDEILDSYADNEELGLRIVDEPNKAAA